MTHSSMLKTRRKNQARRKELHRLEKARRKAERDAARKSAKA
jgi:hypothetical protein